MAGQNSNPYASPNATESNSKRLEIWVSPPMILVSVILMNGYAFSAWVMFRYVQAYFGLQSKLPPRMQDVSGKVGFANGTMIGMSICSFLIVLVALFIAIRNEKRGIAWLLIASSVVLFVASAVLLNPFRQS